MATIEVPHFSVFCLSDSAINVLKKHSCYDFICSFTIKLQETVTVLQSDIWGNMNLCFWAPILYICIIQDKLPVEKKGIYGTGSENACNVQINLKSRSTWVWTYALLCHLSLTLNARSAWVSISHSNWVTSKRERH